MKIKKEITNIIRKHISYANLTHMDESVEMGHWTASLANTVNFL